MRFAIAAAAVVIAGSATRAARADVTQPKPPALVGVAQDARIAPDRGFVDDPVAFDGARVAYVNTDGATFAELVVYDVGAKAEKLRAALPADLGVPQSLRFVGAGDAARLFLVGRADDGAARAALFGLDGKVARRFGPAADVTLVTRAGTPRVALHRAKVKTKVTTHELELVDLDKGKRVGKLRSLDVDTTGAIPKLDFRITYWTEGFTHAMGVKGGHWDPKENQRTPDVAADYDVIDAAFKTNTIDDPMSAAARLQVLASRPAGADTTFAKMSQDLTTVELWRDGAPSNLELDQAVTLYDASTLASTIDDKGAVWIALKIDPVNAAAVKRKIADPEYLDLFAVDGTKAVRKARVLVTPKKKYRWGVATGRWWLLERSVGFDRGGTSLTIYSLGS